MTQQQQRIADMLTAIAGDKNLKLEISPRIDMSSEKAYVDKREGCVFLSLAEPFTDEHITQWEEAICLADKLLINMRNDEQYAENNPNFFKAIVAKIQNLKKYK